MMLPIWHSTGQVGRCHVLGYGCTRCYGCLPRLAEIDFAYNLEYLHGVAYLKIDIITILHFYIDIIDD